ncbi:MAG: 6-bladed beta-propeller [Bacteroidia bacterium]|nr:6-bladed beta-propeller [Bacteroidia bacterium]
MRLFFKHIIFFLFILNQSGNCLSQDILEVDRNRKTENSRIKWISLFPSVENKKSSFTEKLGQVVFGKKEILEISKPISVLAINPDTFLVLDQGNNTIFYVKNNESQIPHFLKKKENYFTSLVGICAISKNEVLFTDSKSNQIYKISNNVTELNVLNDSLKLDQPTGIAYSKLTNEIWVVETKSHRISILNNNGERIKTIGARGNKNGEFNFPTSICIDKDGYAYIVDAMNFRVQIFNKDGQFVSTFGKQGDATGDFARPKGIAIDSESNIYIADALFNTVQIFDKKGNFLYYFGSQGNEKEKFWMPSGIFIDSQNYIYVSDSYNSRIQLFQLVN